METFIAAFLGAFVGIQFLRLTEKKEKIEPLVTNMTKNFHVEPVKKQRVYRDKEIIQEEELHV